MFDRELAKKIQKDWRPLPAAKQNLSMETKKAPNPHELGILKPFQKQDHVVTVRSSALVSSAYLAPSCAKADGALVAAKNKDKPAVSARKYASTSIADLEVPKTAQTIFRTSPERPLCMHQHRLILFFGQMLLGVQVHPDANRTLLNQVWEEARRKSLQTPPDDIDAGLGAALLLEVQASWSLSSRFDMICFSASFSKQNEF